LLVPTSPPCKSLNPTPKQDLLLRKLPFARLVRELTINYNNTGLRWQAPSQPPIQHHLARFPRINCMSAPPRMIQSPSQHHLARFPRINFIPAPPRMIQSPSQHHFAQFDSPATGGTALKSGAPDFRGVGGCLDLLAGGGSQRWFRACARFGLAVPGREPGNTALGSWDWRGGWVGADTVGCRTATVSGCPWLELNPSHWLGP
jgi:hypothetical protein